MTTPRQFTQRRGLEIAEYGQRDGARDGGRGHHEEMRRDTLRCLGPQPVSLFDAEPVLFVDNDHAEAVELDGILQQRMRADDDARFTRLRPRRAPAFFC